MWAEWQNVKLCLFDPVLILAKILKEPLFLDINKKNWASYSVEIKFLLEHVSPIGFEMYKTSLVGAINGVWNDITSHTRFCLCLYCCLVFWPMAIFSKLLLTWELYIYHVTPWLVYISSYLNNMLLLRIVNFTTDLKQLHKCMIMNYIHIYISNV